MPPLFQRSRRSPSTAEQFYVAANDLAAAGELAASEAAYRQALALAPDFAEAWNNLGNVLMSDGRFADAAACYSAALTRGLVHPLVYYNRATARRRAGDIAAAEADFVLALALQPAYAEAWNNLANLWRHEKHLEQAAAGYLRALRLKPDWDEAHDNLSGALYLLADSGGDGLAQAQALANAWRDEHPAHPVARHLGAALAGEAGDARASDDYVQQVFDCFADHFDRQLTELDYQAPNLLADALALAGIGRAGAGLTVLDAGCGTGWCGPLLRDWARRLDGVDLSPGMLARAAERGSYDALHAAELTAFLLDNGGVYDLIVAADVFCYFGALGEAMIAAAAALRPGGAIAFTVERWIVPEDASAAGRGYLLQAHGRYAHGEAALRTDLAAAGLALLSFDVARLRDESGQPTIGFVVVARRD